MKNSNFQLSEILEPRVGVLASARGFAGFAFLTVRFSATAFTVGGHFNVLSELDFFGRSATLLEYDQNS